MRATDKAQLCRQSSARAGARRRRRAGDEGDARERRRHEDDVAVDLATSARAMREACARGDARALRRKAPNPIGVLTTPTACGTRKRAALRDVDDDGYALIDRAALADDLGAYEWVGGEGRGRRVRRRGATGR